MHSRASAGPQRAQQAKHGQQHGRAVRYVHCPLADSVTPQLLCVWDSEAGLVGQHVAL